MSLRASEHSLCTHNVVMQPLVEVVADDKVPEKRPEPVNPRSLWDAVAGARESLRRLVMSSWFEGGILVVIVCSAIALALENPRDDPESTKIKVLACCCRVCSPHLWPSAERWPSAQTLHWMDFAFNIVFIVEAALRIAALGVWRGPTAYFRNSWNWLDFLVTVVRAFANGLRGLPVLCCDPLSCLCAVRCDIVVALRRIVSSGESDATAAGFAAIEDGSALLWNQS